MFLEINGKHRSGGPETQHEFNGVIYVIIRLLHSLEMFEYQYSIHKYKIRRRTHFHTKSYGKVVDIIHI